MDRFCVLIVDDEQQSRSLIRKLLSVHFPGLVVTEAQNINSAITEIQNNNPSLIFLDIQMRGESGFELLDQVQSPSFEVIFTTAHSEFAVKAFRYSALDYLLKPIDTKEFMDAVNKALARIRNQQSSREQINFLKEIRSAKNLPDKLTVSTQEGFLFISINDILYCHAIGNYTEFCLDRQQKIVSSSTLGYYHEILNAHRFFRVHRSYIVNLAHVKMYRKGDGGSLVMNNGDEIEVSRNNKENLLRMFKSLN